MSKKALLVGINEYKVPSFKLNGCVNDVESLNELLVTKYDFLETNITILKDVDATRSRILEEIKKLWAGVVPGDTLIFGFAGHGTETIKADDQTVVEAIIPYETTTTASLISNRDINAIAKQAIEENNLSGRINFTAIYDCCHSGQMYRMLNLGSNGEFDVSFINRAIDLSQLLPENPVRDVELTSDLHVFSACRHNQTAADMKPRPALNLDRPRGAFSFTLHNILRGRPQISPSELEAQLPQTLQDLVKPHLQVPVFAVPEAYKDRPIFTI